MMNFNGTSCCFKRTHQTKNNSINQILEYDKRRQSNREAITALKKVVPSQKTQAQIGKRIPVERESWYFNGNCFIQLPTSTVIEMLEADQIHVEAEIDKTNAALKKNVEQLLLMEGLSEDFTGFTLNPINK